MSLKGVWRYIQARGRLLLQVCSTLVECMFGNSAYFIFWLVEKEVLKVPDTWRNIFCLYRWLSPMAKGCQKEDGISFWEQKNLDWYTLFQTLNSSELWCRKSNGNFLKAIIFCSLAVKCEQLNRKKSNVFHF